MNGIVFDIKELAIHDGPGLRTTVFLKGCPLRCRWCHNPEGLSARPQLSFRSQTCQNCGLCRRGCSHPDCQSFGRCLHICPQGLLSVSGKEMTPEQLANRLKRSRFLNQPGCGVTFSGGEPLMQPDFLREVLERLPGVHSAIETSGYAPEAVFQDIIPRLNLIYMDIKLADDTLHRKYTGVSNARILNNLEFLKTCGVPAVIRTPLISGITDTEENLSAIASLIGDLPWEQLPENPMAGAKYPLFQMEYPMNHPTERT